MKSKKLLALSMSLVLGLSMVGGVFTASAESEDVIKVGGLFNVTGEQSSLDDPSQRGFELAVAQINDAGGINGHMVEAVYYDGKTDQTTCASSTTKLIDSDGVVAIGGLSDNDYAYAAGAVAQEAGVPIVFSGATSPDIPNVIGDYAFMTAFGDDVCAHAAADFFYNDLGARTVYILTDNSMSYTTTLTDYFVERFEELGGEVILQDYFSSGDYDFSAQINRYLSLGEEADAMFMSTGPDDASTVIEQYRSAGVTAPMISGDGWDTDLWSVAGDLANQDIYAATHYSADDDSEVVQDFIAAYTEMYGKEPENAFAALGYDCANIIFTAIEMCGDDITTENIRDNLEKITDLQCVTGTISYTPENHVPDKTVVITKAEDGVLTFVTNS